MKNRNGNRIRTDILGDLQSNAMLLLTPRNCRLYYPVLNSRPMKTKAGFSTKTIPIEGFEKRRKLKRPLWYVRRT